MGDERFRALKTDPRYRLPNRKETRTRLDPRFQGLLRDKDFHSKADVDRYGRKINHDKGRKELEKRYFLDEEAEGSGSGSEDERLVGSEDENAKRKLDPARHGGFSESSSEEEDSSDDDDDESGSEIALAKDTAGHEQTEQIPMGEVTKRIGCVNLDWDHIRASDILAVSSSFAPPGGRVERVTVYPSEFGRERLEKEEIEGPPREIFASSARNVEIDEEEDEGDTSDEEERIKKQLLARQASEGNEFDTGKLRKYQLERLRYYYAVIECDSKTTGKALYDSMDGREYLTSANFFDLRFIPDDVSFDDDQPRDKCSSLPDGYKPNEFTTEALTHSKVRLTWDDEDTTRKEVQKRAFTRAEMDENDLQAYIGSDSSDADSISSRKSSVADRKAKKKEAARAEMRAALGLATEAKKSKSSKDGPVGDMQITFTSALGGGKAGKGVFENEPQDEESTRARYIRKEKERKQKRKEKARAAKNGESVDKEPTENEIAQNGEDESNPDDPFDDPFFNDPKAAAEQEKKAKQAEKQKKRDAKTAREAEAESRKAELKLLMAGDADESGMRHFDMREIEKAEKDARRKGKKGKGKKGDKQEIVTDDFKVDTGDPRFKDVFESHDFAIDPNHPRFRGTDGMKAILEESRKKRKRAIDAEDGDLQEKKAIKNDKVNNGEAELNGLVARLKGVKKSKKG